MADLFKPKVPEDKFHINFEKVWKDKSHTASRAMANHVYNTLNIFDSHFRKDFQTAGFDARIWELYLAAVFNELDFGFETSEDRPDFHIKKNGVEIFVEATISNTPDDKETRSKMEILDEYKDDNEGFQKYMIELRKLSTFKLAQALQKKLRKKYWELSWVTGKPLVIAVEAFHHPLAHMLSDRNLTGYLYGFEQSLSQGKQGQPIINVSKVDKHQVENKSMKSGFFYHPDTEFISAVIFCNSGTISKFNRMGKLKGFGDEGVEMLRMGFHHDPNPNAVYPLSFVHRVGIDEGANETWTQGMTMCHNPNALYPVDRKLFPNMLHGYWDNGFLAHVPNFHPYSSETIVLVSK